MPATLLPPGPRKLLTGNLADTSPEYLAFFTRCAREFGDIATFRIGPRRIVLLSQPQLIEEVLVTNAKSFTKHFGAACSRLPLGNGLELYQRRSVLAPATATDSTVLQP